MEQPFHKVRLSKVILHLIIINANLFLINKYDELIKRLFLLDQPIARISKMTL